MKRLKELYIGEWYKFGLLVIVLTAFLFMAAVTTIDLAVNVRGVLGTTNGGTGQNSAMTGPDKQKSRDKWLKQAHRTRDTAALFAL